MSKQNFNNVAGYMTAIRAKLDMTQAEMAQKAKVHTQYVSNWERGQCLPPKSSVKLFMKDKDIKAVFDVDVFIDKQIDDERAKLRKTYKK